MTAPPAEHERLLTRWSDWIERITLDLIRGHLHQHVWRSVRDEILRVRPEADQSFLVSYSAIYADGQVMRVRRIADTHPDSDSLINLLDAIRRNPKVMTRERYADRHAERTGFENGWAMGAAEWDDLFAAQPGDEEISGDLVARDQRRLTVQLEHLTAWATKTLAHLDPLRPTVIPQYQDISRALDLLAEITGRYSVFIRGWAPSEWKPFMQGDWEAVFRPTLFASPLVAERSRYARDFT